MRILLLLVLLITSSCYLTDEVLEDQQIWEYDFPSNQQMSEAELLALNTFVSTGRFEFIRSLMIVKNDKLVFENHYVGGSRNALRPVDKLTLIFTQLAVGKAIEDGLIDSIQTPIYHLLPDYAYVFDQQPTKREITIEHLLIHRAGFSWNEAIIASESPNNDSNLLEEAPDATAYILEKPLEAVPGLRYNFNSGTGYIVSKIIEEVAGSSLEEYVAEHIFEPLEIQNYRWSTDPTGTTNGSTGLEISPFDLLKVGQLYLNEGLWDGEELIPFDWFNASTTMQLQITDQFGYGYYWNKFTPEFESNLFQFQDERQVFVNGDSGDALYILPSKNLAVVIYAENFFYGFFNPSFQLYRGVVGSLE